MKRDKLRNYIMFKGLTQEGDITVINIYAPSIGALQYVRQMLTSVKGEINSSSIRVRDFDTLITAMDNGALPRTKAKLKPSGCGGRNVHTF